MGEKFLISYQECKENVSTFPSSFKLVPHNVSGIPATLWPTMWEECEENASLNEDAYRFLEQVDFSCIRGFLTLIGAGFFGS